MAVVDHHRFTGAQFTKNVAHFVKANFVEAQLTPFFGYTLANIAQLAFHAGNGDNFAQELNDILAPDFYLVVKCIN